MPRSKSRRSQRRPLRVVSTPSSVATFPESGSPEGNAVANVAAIAIVAEPVDRRSSAPRLRKATKPPSLWRRGIMAGFRIGILGVGLGAIAGTTLTTFTPTRFIQADKAQSTGKEAMVAASAASGPGERPRVYPQQTLASLSAWVSDHTAKIWPSPATAASQTDPSSKLAATTATAPMAATVTPTTENQALKAKLTKLATSQGPKIVPYAYFVDVDNGQFVSLNGQQVLPAASTIKIPVAIAFFQAVDQGKIQLHEQLPLTKDVVASGSGDMQYQIGKQASYSALEVATKMIVISDNTATNMLIKRLGGMEALNRQFQAWQLPHTKFRNLLPDLEGTNTTSPQDLAMILARLQAGDLLSLKSRDRLLNIMQQTKTRTLLPQGLEPDAIIAHKTGDIGTILGDAGVIDMPNGKRYVGAVMATRPFNDVAARTLIQDISRTVYQHFKGVMPPPPAPTVAQQSKSPAKPAEPKPQAAPTP